MSDRCQSEVQGSKVCAEELATLLGLKDREMAVELCALYSKVGFYTAHKRALSSLSYFYVEFVNTIIVANSKALHLKFDEFYVEVF